MSLSTHLYAACLRYGPGTHIVPHLGEYEMATITIERHGEGWWVDGPGLDQRHEFDRYGVCLYAEQE